ncbi:MAG: biopolymer transporter ExbD [Nitrospinota bacterium]|nr:biopolymer transporter ExbD [Nitrospinota bacterium]MEC9019442.1 biopolymer transporter ExbD [Nitrospinota bacterium]MEC9424079.1 biopolymer transporter ExbD [Nitrospinota bacterium]MED5353308.1 biopolymer transporter ExbD [Nitrospinota bacterium]MEE3252979.1 biopolymer transporter ExbD [Nitrospinota bacterium]
MLDLFPSRRKRFQIDMAPLIDVVFLLLIFFMLTFAIQGQGLAISLPEGEEAEKVDKDIIVKIDRNNKLYLNDKTIQIDALGVALSQDLEKRSDKLVVIDSAPKVKYELFARVLDVSREAGAENFSIIK